MSHSYTVTIELPYGYTDEGGTVHRETVMRPVKNKDLIDLNKDPRFVALRKGNFSMPAGLVAAAQRQFAAIQKLTEELGGDMDAAIKQLQKQGSSELDGMVDPIQMEAANAANTEMNCILYSRLIERIGSITQVNQAILQELHPLDMGALQLAYTQLNSNPPRHDGDEGKDPNGGS